MHCDNFLSQCGLCFWAFNSHSQCYYYILFIYCLFINEPQSRILLFDLTRPNFIVLLTVSASNNVIVKLYSQIHVKTFSNKTLSKAPAEAVCIKHIFVGTPTPAVSSGTTGDLHGLREAINHSCSRWSICGRRVMAHHMPQVTVKHWDISRCLLHAQFMNSSWSLLTLNMSLAVGKEQPTSNQAVLTRLVRHCPNHPLMVTVAMCCWWAWTL